MRIRPIANKGFTVLEVSIVLAITLVMTAALIPNIRVSLANYRLNSNTQQVASQVQLARMRALRDNKMSAFLVAASGRQFGVDNTGDGNITSGTSDTVFNLDSDITFSGLTTPPTAASGATTLSTGNKTGIGFTPRGTLTAVTSSGTPDYNPANLPTAGFAIYLSNNENHYAAVTVSATGRVRTWTSANGTSWKSAY